MPDGVTFEMAARQIEEANGPDDLFGIPPKDRHDVYLRDAKTTYKRLAKIVHPDVNVGDPNADYVFARLGAFYDKLEERARAGTLGRFTISTKTREYALSDTSVKGDLASVFHATASTDPKNVVVKIVRKPQNSDLLVREVKALHRLDKKADPRLRPYAPKLVESFRYTSPDGKQRQTNVLERLVDAYTLADVRKAYPTGLDARDAAWMWRRMLVGLGWAHQAGVIHGAVLPANIMIFPEQHGVVFIDWCYSVIDDGRIPAVVSKYQSFYPEEVAAKEPSTPGTDIFMAAKVFRWLLDAQAPRQLRAFIKGCTLSSAGARPNDAWDLLEEFDELLGRLYGPRRFRPFAMPSGGA